MRWEFAVQDYQRSLWSGLKWEPTVVPKLFFLLAKICCYLLMNCKNKSRRTKPQTENV